MVENIPLNKILPDENQPRKFFSAEKMYTLKQSIKKHGVKVPIVVEPIKGTDKFLLIDGERRYRTAVDLKLDTIPAMIEEEKTEEERLVEQFSIQEQHEQWTPVEKAMAILALSKIMGLSTSDTCKRLDIDSRSTPRYVAFAELADKESFVRNEVPIDQAVQLQKLKSVAKKVSVDALDVEFTRSDEKKLEHQFTKMILRGTLSKRSDTSKIMDSFRKNPKMIGKFMSDDTVTPDSLYLEAKAKGVHALRNAYGSSRAIVTHGRVFLTLRDVKITADQVEAFKEAKKVLTDLIGLVE